MALNFSHRVSPITIANREVENCSRADRGVSQESVSNDIIDLLPSDPFGMDISTTFTAITGWLGNLEVDYGGYGMAGDIAAANREYEWFTRLNFLCNNAMRFQQVSENVWLSDKGPSPSCSSNNEVRNEVPNLEGGAPHASFCLALGYLGVRDLIAVECVCKYLRSTVQADAFLWRNLHINHPFNEKITDDVVLKLSSRAEGQLQSLSLMDCPRITDECLKQVINTNPKLIKISVPGCSRLSIDAIVNSLKGRQGIKKLRIGGIYGMTQEHLNELTSLLGTNINTQIKDNTRKPRYFHQRNSNLSCDDDDDDSAIDIEACPRCHEARLVYDCPAEACQEKKKKAGSVDEMCRACTRCISRCVQCGWCINDNEYEETFCLEMICFKCHEEREIEAGRAQCSILHGPNQFCSG